MPALQEAECAVGNIARREYKINGKQRFNIYTPISTLSLTINYIGTMTFHNKNGISFEQELYATVQKGWLQPLYRAMCNVCCAIVLITLE